MNTTIYPKNNEQDHKLDKTQIMLDLNEELANFTTTFKINADGPFEYLVVSQTVIDSSTPFVFKKSEKNTASGSIRINDNVFQNYFLVLRSETPVTAKVKISMIDLGPNTQLHTAVKNSMYSHSNNTQETVNLLVNQNSVKSTFNGKQLAIFAVVTTIIIFFVLYFTRGQETTIDASPLASIFT